MNLLKLGSEFPGPGCAVTHISRMGVDVKMADGKRKFFTLKEVEEAFEVLKGSPIE